MREPNLHRAIVHRGMQLADVSLAGDGRTVIAYATPFDATNYIEDQHGKYFERIARTAYAKTLSESASRVIVLFNHGRDLHGVPRAEMLIPIGQPLDIRPDGKGLLTRTRYFETELGDVVLDAVKNGALKAYSHESAVIRTARVGTQDGLPIFEHSEMKLYEYGPGVLPHVLEGAEILAVRSATLADRMAGVDLAKADAATMADLAAILERIDTSPVAPPEEGTPTGTPPTEPTGTTVPPVTPPEEGTSPEEIAAQERRLATMRAELDARERRHL